MSTPYLAPAAEQDPDQSPRTGRGHPAEMVERNKTGAGGSDPQDAHGRCTHAVRILLACYD